MGFLTKKYFWSTKKGNLIEQPDGNGYNPYEAHVSAWKIKTFKAFGYRCYGGGLKFWSSWFWGLAEFTYFSYRIPFISGMLVCVKLLGN